MSRKIQARESSTKPELIPFFPYETRDRNEQLNLIRRKYSERAAEHKAKFEALWKESLESQARSTARSKALIQKSIDSARNRTKQFVSLAKIDQSIIRERTREYLYSSDRRIKKEMFQARETVQGIVSGSGAEKGLRDQMKQARSYVEHRATQIELDAMRSAREILKRRELMQERYSRIYVAAQKKVSKGKEKLRKAQLALTSAVADRVEEVKTPESTMLSEGEHQTFKRDDLTLMINEKVKTDLDSAQRRVENATSNYTENARRIKLSTVSTGQKAMAIGQSHLHQMQKNLLASKELFEIDVRFAQAKVKEASKKSKIIGTQMTVVLSQRRKAAIMRARARRKAQAIRNALALIRTMG
ncbi:MAG: hypothetical protein PXY39_00780 [archaeon]|nr:hypothetical protein [archaeon]